MRIIGIHDGHNATACLLEDGKIQYVIQEERLTRIKNHSCFPSSAIQEILRLTQLDYKDLDFIVFSSRHMPKNLTREELIKDYWKSESVATRLKRAAKKTFVMNIYKIMRKEERIHPLISEGYPRENIVFMGHHSSHAAAAYFGCPWWKNEPVLVLTNDAGGDGLCATVNIGEKGRIKRLAQVTTEHSLGYIYSMITFVLSMVPEEHEYKVMGMAPYCSEVKALEVYEKFNRLISFNNIDDGITWMRSSGCPSTQYSYKYFKNFTEGIRFDWLCGGLQIFFEETILEWIRRCIQKTGIRKIALGGGLFMNVKANKRIRELPEVDEMFVFPSCGDESNAIGCAYLKYAEEKLDKGEEIDLAPLKDLYFGPEFRDIEIEQVLGQYPYHYQKYNDIEQKVAALLADDQVVARFKGRMEFGARALGNRSILADPSHTQVIRTINEMIKNRDFWMPFAPSILETHINDYIGCDRTIQAPYMMIAFNSKNKNNQIVAASHPYDHTIRPQIVYEKWNPDYYRLIKYFEKLTGIGAILNTSFNLHGYPIVCSPKDALEVFMNSGLNYMAIGNFLVGKQS
jgi:carbamoyltransferase